MYDFRRRFKRAGRCYVFFEVKFDNREEAERAVVGRTADVRVKYKIERKAVFPTAKRHVKINTIQTDRTHKKLRAFGQSA